MADFENANPYAAPQSDLAPDAYAESMGQLQYANFWQRFVAAFVDGIILQVLGMAVGAGLGAGLAAAGLGALEIFVASTLAGLVLGWMYSALQESSDARATIGKRLMSLKVIDLSGQQISFGQATGRHFGKILSGALLLIGYLMQPFTEKKQALHDMMAGTLVIKA